MKTIRYIITAAVLLTMTLIAPSIHPLNAAEQATITFINQTQYWLTFSIDGRKSSTVPPGDQGSDLTTVGQHALRAKVTGKDLSVSRTMDIPATGRTWTITGEE
jgi:hypothetical protein